VLVAHLGVLGVLGLAWLPSAHVHADDHHDVRAETVHRHLAPHHAHDSDSALDHAEGEARYLSSPFAPEKVASRIGPGDFVVSDLRLPELPRSSRPALTGLTERVHDPPWRTSLGPRAPPLSLA
jgi:hypothetical protein